MQSKRTNKKKNELIKYIFYGKQSVPNICGLRPVAQSSDDSLHLVISFDYELKKKSRGEFTCKYLKELFSMAPHDPLVLLCYLWSGRKVKLHFSAFIRLLIWENTPVAHFSGSRHLDASSWDGEIRFVCFVVTVVFFFYTFFPLVCSQSDLLYPNNLKSPSAKTLE